MKKGFDQDNVSELESVVRMIDKELYFIQRNALTKFPYMIGNIQSVRDRVKSLLNNAFSFDSMMFILVSEPVYYIKDDGYFYICTNNQLEVNGEAALMKYKKFDVDSDSSADFIKSYFEENPSFYDTCLQEYRENVLKVFPVDFGGLDEGRD